MAFPRTHAASIGASILAALLAPTAHATFIGDQVEFVLLNDAREERFRTTVQVDDDVEIAFCLRAIDDACVIDVSFDVRESSITSELINRSGTQQALGASFIRFESLDWLDPATELSGFLYSELTYPITPDVTLVGSTFESFTPGFTIEAEETFTSVGSFLARAVPEPGSTGLIAAGCVLLAGLRRYFGERRPAAVS